MCSLVLSVVSVLTIFLVFVHRQNGSVLVLFEDVPSGDGRRQMEYYIFFGQRRPEPDRLAGRRFR